MLFDKFLTLIESHAEQLTEDWIKEVKRNPCTSGYNALSDEILSTRIYDVYKRLGSWLQTDETNYKLTADHFIRLGRERAAEGLNVSEVIYAIILARVTMWQYVLNEGIIDSVLDFQKALVFNQKVNNFFDKAVYFVAIGYESLNAEDQSKIYDEEFISKAVKSVTNWFIKY